MAQKVLWTIRITQTLTADLWQRFVTRTREAGTTPARVLEDFIARYAGAPSHDTPPEKER